MNKKHTITMILSSILTFFGCKKKEDLFLQNNRVILCCSSINFPDCKLTTKSKAFEKEHKISFKEASKIYLKNLAKYENIDSLDSEVIPTLIINEYYVYSFKNIKMSKVAAFGTGINADTGEIIHYKNKIWLYEDEILKNTKTSTD